MTKFFLKIYDFFSKRKALLFTVTILLSIVCILLATQMKFSEDISSFLPEDEQNEHVNYAYQHIGVANTLLVYFENENQYAAEDAVETFVNKLSDNNIDDFAKKIQYSVDEAAIIEKMEFIVKNLPYFLDENDYEKFDTLITKEHIINQLENDKDILSSFYGGIMQTVIANDPLFLSGELLQGLQGFKMNDNFETRDGYIFTKGSNEAVVIIESKYPLSETANNKKLIKLIDKTAEETRIEFPNVKITPFGAAYISVNNADQIKKDSILTVAIALILIVLILVRSFRSFKIMITLPAALAFGMAFAFGICAIVYNEVSIIAIGISSVIIGIAANYPLHLLDHKFHNFGTRQTLNDIVNPLTIGNITTVGAFLSLLFISSPAMKNLGLFAAMLLVGTILFVLIVMPHLIPEKSKYYSEKPKRIFNKISDLHFENSNILIGVVLVLTIVFMFLDKAGFNADMSKINFMTNEHRELMAKINADTQDSDKMLLVVTEGSTTDEALQKYESICTDLQSFTKEDSTLRLTSIGNYIPSKEKQSERIALWNDFWKRHDIKPLLDEASTEVGFKQNAFDGFYSTLNIDYQPHSIDYFSPIASDLADNYIVRNDSLNERALVFSILHIKPQLFDNVRVKVENESRFNSNGIFVFNQDSILSQIVESLSDDFDFVLYVCSFIVFFFLLISFGRLELTIISFLPLAVGWIWILAIMQIFDIQFNIINIILATFIFGMGDDYTIFITEGCIYEHRFGKKMLDTYKNTVALSAFIMFVGIGVLILAKHPAMKGLGEVVIIGMFTVVLMAYIIPPFLFKWLTTKNGQPRRNPVTLYKLGATALTFSCLFFGALILDVIGFFLLTIGGKTEKHKLMFHKCVRFAFSVMDKCNYSTKQLIINESGEDNPFAKPSIIIANHQSLHDLLICKCHPKMVAMTKHLWNTPVIGWLLKYADYFPLGSFDKDNIEKFKSLISNGYSIIIFPEGSRSEDFHIQRFHKGAFFLAQQLGVDIQPVIMHGNGYTLPKKTALAKKGVRHIHILPKIKTQNTDYHDVCKSTHKFYIEKYADLCKKYENADYYADEVVNNYLYKGKDIEKYVRKSLKINNNYNKLIDSIPDSGVVLLKNCGVGQASLLAALVRKETEIYALIEDEDDFLTAKNCASVPENLHYITDYQCIKYDLEIDCERNEIKSPNS